MYNLGLIGYPLSHSFSKKYFDLKFHQEKIKNFSYKLFDIGSLSQLNHIIDTHNLIGFNVTSPYKEAILPHIHKLDKIAKNTNSVNTVFIKKNEKIGFNTDFFGFNKLLYSIDNIKSSKALILGSGGTCQTIKYCLNKENIKYKVVSRKPTIHMIKYQEIKKYINEYKIIINTTPLGQYPNIEYYPDIPYELLSPEHYCIDLIYNPTKTIFLQKSELKGACILNGYDMLTEQAKSSWKIWLNLIHS